MKNNDTYDFVGIGDITTDAFIELINASVHCDIDNENCTICMNWGDKIPFKDVVVVPAVGNSPNASVSAARLGLSSALVTNVGNDMQGEECVDQLRKNRVSTEFVRVHEDKKTNYHYVLSFNAERTILIKHEEYSYSLPSFSKEPKLIYLSSIPEHALSFHTTIVEYIKQCIEPPLLVFQPGTFQISLGYEKLKEVYKNTSIFFCNKEEARKILKFESSNMERLLVELRNRGPNIVVITDGKNGAYCFDGKTAWHCPAYPDPKPPLERTGAGDSFASTFSSYILLGYSPEDALLRAAINSMSVVQCIGAQEGLLSQEEIERWLKKAPPYYANKKLF